MRLALRQRGAGVRGGHVVLQQLVHLLQRLLVLVEDLQIVDGRGRTARCGGAGRWRCRSCRLRRSAQGPWLRQARDGTGDRYSAAGECGAARTSRGRARLAPRAGGPRASGRSRARPRGPARCRAARWWPGERRARCAQTAQAAMWARAAAFPGAAGSQKQIGKSGLAGFAVHRCCLPFLRRRVV